MFFKPYQVQRIGTKYRAMGYTLTDFADLKIFSEMGETELQR